MNNTTHTPATTITAAEIEIEALKERLAAVQESEQAWAISCNQNLKRAEEAEAEVCKLAAELSKTTDALFKLIERNKKLREFIINAITATETSGTPSEGKSNG